MAPDVCRRTGAGPGRGQLPSWPAALCSYPPGFKAALRSRCRPPQAVSRGGCPHTTGPLRLALCCAALSWRAGAGHGEQGPQHMGALPPLALTKDMSPRKK